jgi:hypothetical protein
VASFFAASRKDVPSAFGFHACAEAVRFVATAHMGLKGAFRQRAISFKQLAAPSVHRKGCKRND